MDTPTADRQPDDYDVWSDCHHDWHRDGITGGVIIHYTCAKCGMTDQKDVS